MQFPFIHASEIYQVQRERECLSVSMSLLLPKFSSKGIQKINEDSNFGHMKIECEAVDISRRYFNNGINKKGANSREGTL